MAKYECLDIANPELIDEWHPTKNGSLSPCGVTQKSGQTVWWLGKCGHEWQAKVYTRTSGHGCPYCSNVKVLPGFNDLSSKNPNLAKEWHPNKNGYLKPDMIAPTSNKKVWWLGNCGHEWQATINSRYFGNGCPICANQQILSGYNDLATKNPNLAKEWHPTKNDNLTPSTIAPRSSKKVWWQCEKGHEWQATVAARSKGDGCPYCSNKKVLKKYNDLATKEPCIAREWHPTKNGFLTPDMITDGSSKVVWWLCEKGHEWQATVTDRVRGHGCPICANQHILSGYNDLETRHPLVAKEWHPTKNGDLKPYMVINKSRKKVWWLGNCGHEWQATIKDRVDGTGCPICKGKQILKGENDFATLYPEIAKEWHPNKNGQLKPDMVTYGSGKTVWWMCKKGHEWQAAVTDRVQGNNCPVCANQQILQGYNDLETQYPLVAKEWHPTKNGDIKPNTIAPRSSKKVWWLCTKGHEWKTSISSRTSGGGCPICSNRKILPGFNDLATKNPNLAKEWHPTKNGDLKPTMIAPRSSKKVWWLCENGHEWQAKVSDRSYGTKCPICRKSNS